MIRQRVWDACEELAIAIDVDRRFERGLAVFGEKVAVAVEEHVDRDVEVGRVGGQVCCVCCFRGCIAYTVCPSEIHCDLRHLV